MDLNWIGLHIAYFLIPVLTYLFTKSYILISLQQDFIKRWDEKERTIPKPKRRIAWAIFRLLPPVGMVLLIIAITLEEFFGSLHHFFDAALVEVLIMLLATNFTITSFFKNPPLNQTQ